MKFTIKRDVLQTSLDKFSKIIDTKSELLNIIKFEVLDFGIRLSATNLNMGMVINIDCIDKEESPFTIFLKYTQLFNIVRQINFNEIVFEIESENNVKISNGDILINYEYESILAQYISDSINIDYSINENNGIDSDILLSMISKTQSSIAIEDTRFVFNGLLTEFKDDFLTIVCTDGKRISKIKRSIDNFSIGKQLIIPHDSLGTIVQILKETEKIYLNLDEESKNLVIGYDENLFFTRLIDGSYPDYNSVIPIENQFKITVDKSMFTIALRQAIVTSDIISHQIFFEVENTELKIYSIINNSKTSIELKIESNVMSKTIFSFRGDFILDALKQIESDEIVFEFNSNNSPFVFRDNSDPNWISVIMPMKS